MNPRTLLAAAADRLRAAGVDSPEPDARLLLAHACARRPTEMALLDDVPAAAAARFEDLVARRALREPLQHLTGEAWFRHLVLAVGPGVFVPRPETEVLTGWVIAWLRARPATAGTATVVDLGSGSGAIAKAIATEVPGTVVHAVEVAEEAARWAALNLAGTEVRLHVTDAAHALPELDGGVDAVVSNPPYIPLDAYESVAPEARDHDPTLALFAGGDGLDMIRVVTDTARRLLRAGGLLAVEHAEVQARSVPSLVAAAGGFVQIGDHRDLAGRPRFVTAVRAR